MGSYICSSSRFYGYDVCGTALFLLTVMGQGFSSTDNNRIRSGVIVGMAIVLIVAGYFSWKQYERYLRIKTEVAVLEVERERVRKENESLKERINYVATENFQEKESKERLNMRKDNEYVVDIEGVESTPQNSPKASAPADTSVTPAPNYKKWWSKVF